MPFCQISTFFLRSPLSFMLVMLKSIICHPPMQLLLGVEGEHWTGEACIRAKSIVQAVLECHSDISASPAAVKSVCSILSLHPVKRCFSAFVRHTLELHAWLSIAEIHPAVVSEQWEKIWSPQQNRVIDNDHCCRPLLKIHLWFFFW